MALQKASKSGATPFKFENTGDTLRGYYQGQVKKTINGMPAIEHTYKTKQGTVGVLGQANILKQYENNGVTPGTYVEITFSGEKLKLKGGKTMKVYDVAYDLDDRDDSPFAPSNEDTAEVEDDSEEGDTTSLSNVVAPRVVASTTSAANQARVQALLSRNKNN